MEMIESILSIELGTRVRFFFCLQFEVADGRTFVSLSAAQTFNMSANV